MTKESFINKMHANSSEKEKAKNMLSDYFKEFTLNVSKL